MIQYRAADKLYELILERIKDTDWRYVQAYNIIRFSGILANKDIVPPTKDDIIAGNYPENYFRIDSDSFESFQIGILETLNRLGL